jgi:hypothetical protein
MSKESFITDNLVTGTKPLLTRRVLSLEAGQSVVRGEILKKGTTGLVALTATEDTPYRVSLQTVDATASAKEIIYTYDASLKSSELVFGAGSISNFRDKFVTSTSLLIEE